MARTTVYRSKQLSDKLKRIRDQTKDVVRAAMAREMEGLVATMKRYVPDGVGTGDRDLGESIRWKFGDADGAASTSGRSNATSAVALAGDRNNPEARWVEFGTAPHVNAGQFAGTLHPGTAPQPFFFPAYRARKKGIKRAINKAIRDAIKGAVK